MKLRALKAAFPHTIPILAGFLFLGMTYGIYMGSLGFSFVYPMGMAMIIFAGSMEFVTANLLVGAFDPLQAFLMTLMINARHLFITERTNVFLQSLLINGAELFQQHHRILTQSSIGGFQFYMGRQFSLHL